MKAAPSLVLASGSERRHEILQQAGFVFEVRSADVCEDLRPGESPICAVERLAEAKGACVSEERPADIVLAADTLVACEQTILGKPKDLAEATEMLRFLSGKTHRVFTGLHLAYAAADKARTWHCATEVSFKTLTNADIARYFARCNPLDKAGAYGIQVAGEMIVQGLKGLFSNVMGLPIEELLPQLRSFYDDCGCLQLGDAWRRHKLVNEEAQAWQLKVPADNQTIASMRDAQ